MNKVKMTGIFKEGKFYNNGGTIEVNALFDRNGYNYKVRIEDEALLGKVLALGDEVTIKGKLRIYNNETYILVEEIEE